MGMYLYYYNHCTSSETQGQIVGTRKSLNGRENMARRKVKNGEKSPWGQCLTRPVPNGGLVRHCPQGLFSPFFTFLCAIFFRPFRLFLVPTICPWVSEDDHCSANALCKFLERLWRLFAPQTKLSFRLSPSLSQDWNPCSGSPPVYQDLSVCHDWPVKKPLLICQLGWREIQNALPVIHRVHRGPRTRARGSFLDYICDTDS